MAKQKVLVITNTVDHESYMNHLLVKTLDVRTSNSPNRIAVAANHRLVESIIVYGDRRFLEMVRSYLDFHRFSVGKVPVIFIQTHNASPEEILTQIETSLILGADWSPSPCNNSHEDHWSFGA